MDSRTFVKVIRSGARAADGSLPAEVWAERETARTITSFDNGEVRATVLAVTGGAQQDQFIRPGGVSPTLAHASNTHAGNHQPKAWLDSGVRRLTPVECERLMGWPDDHTAWGIDEDGNRADMPDSTRYRMVGNGVMSPVAEWIGKQILEAVAP